MKSIKLLIVVILISITTVSCGFLRNELGLSDKAAIKFNDLSVSQKDLDADFKSLASNEVLVELYGSGEEPFIDEDGNLAESFRINWANIQLRILAIREARIDNDMKITDEDRKESTEQVKQLFSQQGSDDADRIWEAFDKDFKERLVENYAEQSALLRAADPVTDKEAREYFDENKDEFTKCESGITSRHILVETEESAKDIKAKLDAGEDFAKLAKEHTIDTGSKETGGDLGCFIAGQFVEPFETAITALTPGQISDPVKTDFGYHIIQTETFVVPEFKDVKDTIVARLEPTKQQALFEDVEKRFNEAKIVVNEKYGKLIDQDGVPTIVSSDTPDPSSTSSPQGSTPDLSEILEETPTEEVPTS